MICEISQNIRYQYNFIILWFFFAVGVFISVLGFLFYVLSLARHMYWIYYQLLVEEERLSDKVNAQLTIREMEYLDKINQMDMTMYGEIVRELIRFKPNIGNMKKFASQISPSEMVNLMPTAPGDNV